VKITIKIKGNKMYSFSTFKNAVSDQFVRLEKGMLLTSKVSKDELWEIYLGSFPEGSNPIFRERTAHDCACCKQFIRTMGDVVGIIDGKFQSIWDIDIGGHYQVVADALSKLSKTYPIDSVFLHYERSVGTDHNLELTGDGETIRWDHFHQVLPSNVFRKSDQIATLKGSARNNYAVLKRSLDEITEESVDIIIELIEQNSLYRGAEHSSILTTLKHAMNKYEEASNKELFLWEESTSLGGSSGFRNTVIGTLLCDLSEGKDLEQAVASFEAKVAPSNYKRPTALITKNMAANAAKTIEELGLTDSLPRRFAVTEDVTINNVLFADRSVQEEMGVFGLLTSDISDKIPELDKVEEVSIDSFLENVLPRADSVELLLDNKHKGNLVSLISPVNKESNNMLKWGNNFTWSYQGEVADSIAQRVKKQGGKVDGYLRISLSWFNSDDLDIHMDTPRGHLYYGRPSLAYAKLDVDMNVGTGGSNCSATAPVENITWDNKGDIIEGEYQAYINNCTKRNSTDVGFVVEMEYEGNIQTFVYNQEVNRDVNVCKFSYSKEGGIKMLSSLPSTAASKEVWGIHTQKFHKVNMMMHSPNHWDGEETGNKHYFFILDKCNNPDPARGFYNEFLSNRLTADRKAFEILGSKLKAPHSDNQLSGLGFSSTQHTQVLARVKGSFNRVVKINF
jgi:hypothetical protein